ncbi:proline--tRNA ligase, partial [Candidatus Gottesmanbacteria bacterium]|nr:proline--tRNA ligase [Candidatus Gottesmanbacteria bacterium]
MKTFEKKEIKKKSTDFDRWYTDVILRGELADYSPVKGCMIIRPYGYEIWERIQSFLDGKFKGLGVKNAYFPLFIPNSFLQKEKEHVEGFSPQLAVVTIGGGEKLAEPLVVRPTSETIMYDAYSRWIQSWRDLPLLLNLWNNVVRWEKRTYLFLRTTEFLWQEGHTAHASFEDADNFAKKILEIYKKFDEEILAIPVLVGRKSQSEKFPGASITYALESLMPDGKVIQMGTSHHLGDNFAKAFNIRYLDKKGQLQYVFQTSWAET